MHVVSLVDFDFGFKSMTKHGYQADDKGIHRAVQLWVYTL